MSEYSAWKGYPPIEERDAEIARLRGRIQMAEAERDAANSLAKNRYAEIERLRGEVTKYKARMQLLRRWGYSERQWYVTCQNHAEAYDWFDQDGVPI